MAALSGPPRLVILDRDGVINEDSPEYVKSPAEWRPLPGSLDAIARLNAAGFTVAVASNQSGIARGYFDTDALGAMHTKFRGLLAEAGIIAVQQGMPQDVRVLLDPYRRFSL